MNFHTIPKLRLISAVAISSLLAACSSEPAWE